MMRNDAENRAYVNHLLAEHRRLHGLLHEARRAIGARKSTAECAAILGQVHDELARHFVEEEAGGCLAEAVSLCPALSGEEREIEAQHPRLLMQLETVLNQLATAEPTAACRMETVHAFDELIRELHAHEAAENGILRRGFGANLVDDEEADIALLS